MDLRKVRTLLADGDGVLWEGDTPMPGLNRFIDLLNERGIAWGLVTNNAMRPAEAYVDKLARFGVAATRQQIFSSATVAADYLREALPPGAPVYVLGEAGIRSAVEAAGFRLYADANEPAEVLAVVVGVDRALTYDKIRIAATLIKRGGEFIGTNPDPTYPTPNGLIPGAGTVIAAVATASGKQPKIIGKPSPTIFRLAMKELGGSPESTAMVGDRLDTDISGAMPLGIGTILVLSGVTSREEAAASAIRADLIFDSIAHLADEWERVIV